MSKQQLKAQIDAIISKRQRERLPRIEDSIKFLNDLLAKLDKLDETIEEVKKQQNEGKGPYYVMMTEDKGMANRFNMVDTKDVRDKISKQLVSLEQLRKRFSRPAVQVAFVGYERQGKSKFQQSISGLGDKVIPAYNGTSCTGAVSVIHNSGGPFHAQITFFNHAEFLNLIKSKLEKFFPNRSFHINSINDLKTVDVSGFKTNQVDLSTEYNKFVDTFINHIDDVAPLIGAPMLDTPDENQVIQHVAQYELFDEIPAGADPNLFIPKKQKNGNLKWQKNYYRYAAVKSANIYTHFPAIDDAKIVLVDTVGMGTSVDNEAIKDEMFRVLREDCDAAVTIFRPDSKGGGFNAGQSQILQEISNRLSSRDPHEWIYYVVNKVNDGEDSNIQNIDAVLEEVTGTLKNMTVTPVARVLDIDGSDSTEVYDRLMNPLLDMVTSNLDNIDSKFVGVANETGEALYREYSRLSEAVSQVISGGSELHKEEGTLFDKLMDGLNYRKSLRHLDEDVYQKNKDVPCKEVSASINEVIDELPDLVSEPEEILHFVELGDATPVIFTKYANILRNKIYSKFEDVNSEVLVPLQEDVKDAIIEVIFNDAQFGKIPLLSYSIENGPSQEWLAALIKDKMPENKYPNLRSMMQFVLDYSLNIEGMIEYNVAKCLDSIDTRICRPLTPKYGLSLDDTADYIWGELVTRTTPIQNSLRKWRDDFAMIPNHSFYARVRKFREKMTDEDKTVQDEIREFYRANRLAIWSDEFANLSVTDKAFGDWNKISKQILDSCTKKSFTVKI